MGHNWSYYINFTNSGEEAGNGSVWGAVCYIDNIYHVYYIVYISTLPFVFPLGDLAYILHYLYIDPTIYISTILFLIQSRLRHLYSRVNI